MTMRPILLPLLISAIPAAACAQPVSKPAAAAAADPATGERMAPFAWLIGEWRGSGWMTLPDGSRHKFESLEKVTSRLSGNAILI